MTSREASELRSLPSGAAPTRLRGREVLQTPVRHQLPAPLLPMLRTAARRLPEQVVARIAVEVPVLVERERMRPVVSDAVAVAVLGFFEGGGACAATVRFREFGRAQAESGASVVLAFSTPFNVWE